MPLKKHLTHDQSSHGNRFGNYRDNFEGVRNNIQSRTKRVEYYLRQWVADSNNRDAIKKLLEVAKKDPELKSQLRLYRRFVERAFRNEFGDSVTAYRGMPTHDAESSNRLKYIQPFKTYTLDPLVAKRYGSKVVSVELKPKDVFAFYLTSPSMEAEGDKEFLVINSMKTDSLISRIEKHLTGEHDQAKHDPTKGKSQADFASVLKNYADWSNLKGERAAILEKDNSESYKKEGTIAGKTILGEPIICVEFTDAEAEAMRGKTVVHNHPSNTSLSRGDIEFALKYGLDKMVAITNDGFYVMEFPPDVKEWGKNSWGEWNELQQRNGDEDQDLWDFNHALYTAERRLFYRDRGKSPKEISKGSKELYHEIWKLFAGKKGWNYYFIPKQT